ncbi:tetratricopeptide repeat protein [Deinococcus taklimakanensis]|uniref:Tetratricopeptide repeat protein n=1 Tax=Deinococcus taklimakanensis TaxID=536443 RepID=A0ABW5P129_9DEIO
MTLRVSLNLLLASDADADTVQNTLETLHSCGRGAEADQALEEWLGSHMSRNEHLTATRVIESLPDAWVNPRVRAMYWMSVRQGGESPEKTRAARQDAERAYAAGDRNPRLMYLLADDRQLDGHDELALQITREALATRMSDADRVRLLHIHADTLEFLKDPTALEVARELLQVAQRAGSTRHIGIANNLIGCVTERTAGFEEAERYYLRAIAIFRRTADQPQLLVHLNNHAQALADRGRPAEAAQLLEEAWQLPSLSVRQRAWLSVSGASLHHQYGHHAEALTAGAMAAQLTREAGLTGQATTAHLLWTERLAFDGQHQRAREILQKAQELIAEDNRYQAQHDFSAGVIAFARGDAERAALKFGSLAGREDLLVDWDAARLVLYRLALQLRDGAAPDLAPLAEALRTSSTDFPLVTDAPLLTGFLAWLGEQPGWRERLDAVFTGEPAGTVPLRLELFGPLEVHTEHGPLRFQLRRSAELFAFLVLHGSATRQDLLNAMFEGSTSVNAIDHLKKLMRGLRADLRPLLPEGAEAVVSERRRYTLNPLLHPSVAWLPFSLFPAPGVRRSGPVQVRGAFLADVRGEWVADCRHHVHLQLRAHLRHAVEAGDPLARQALLVAEGLALADPAVY